MELPPFLTQAEAQARFGDLQFGATRTYMHFSDPDGGEWRPEFGPKMAFAGYRLHVPVRAPQRRVTFKPKRP